jgi:hypothetical protein
MIESDEEGIPVPDEMLPDDERLNKPDATDDAKVPGDDLPVADAEEDA